MLKIKTKELSLWKFDTLSKLQGINHFVSCREGGCSVGEMGGLNLSFKVGDANENVAKNRVLIANAFGVSSLDFIIPIQTHTNMCKIVTQETKHESFENVDAVITNEIEILIGVLSADCVPILLFDPVHRAIGAVHAGWRGTVGEILKNTVLMMKETYGTNPKELYASIGPSISNEVYEVGEVVIKEIERVYGTKTTILTKEKNGKAYCNLWEANKIQLTNLGVPSENIEVAGICTFTNSTEFFSYRKHGIQAGRFAAGIMLT